MKYLKNFESTLEPSLIDCFDGFEGTNFNIFSHKNQTKAGEYIEIRPKRPEFFEMNENLKEEIISSIGKAEEIGYKLEVVIVYNGFVSKCSYYNLNQFIKFEIRSINFRYDHLTKINIVFK